MRDVGYRTEIRVDANVVERLIPWLQVVALNLLQRVLDRARPGLGDFVLAYRPGQAERGLAPGPGWEPSPLAQQDYAQAVKESINAHRPDRVAWRGRVVVEIERRLGLDPHYGLPEGFWPLVETRAWRDLSFERAVALRLEGELRRRVLFAPGEHVVFRFHPRTLWLLIAMAAAEGLEADRLTPGTSWRGFRRWWRRIRRRPDRRPPDYRWLDHLQALGVERGLVSDWATVWDQWLLLEAHAHWGLEKQPRSLEQALSTLPLRQYPADAATSATKPDSWPPSQVWLSHPDWQVDVPKWFETWLEQLASRQRTDRP